MKLFKAIKNSALQLSAMLVLSFISVQTFAQDKKVDVSINTNGNNGSGGNWYGQPWIWVVGAAVFIIIIVAILRGSGRRD